MAVEEVVPELRTRRPGEGDYRRVAPQEVRPAAHQDHHLVEGRAVAGHVDDHGAVGLSLDLTIDGRDELALGGAARRAEDAELLDCHDAGRAWRLRAARAVGLDEVT